MKKKINIILMNLALFIIFFAGKINEKSNPNIIIIVTDDHRWDDLGCSGNNILSTPNIDNLANKGFLFQNAFVTTSICMASRASIMTGLYEKTHGCNFNTADLKPEFWQKSYPILLKESGYKTAFVGKFGFAVKDTIREHNVYGTVWLDEKNLPINSFDKWYGFAGQGDYFPDEDTTKHLTEIITENAIDFINNQNEDSPFCLSISYKAPHDPGEPIKRIREKYNTIEIPQTENSEEKYFESLPDFIKNSHAHQSKFNNGYWYRKFSTKDKYQESMRNYYSLIEGIDESIGKIVNALSENKLDQNTVIIIIGDNGFLQSEKQLGGKVLLYEPSIRVPLIIYDPRMKENECGIKFSQLALNIDIAPTVLGLAGIKSDFMEGRDLYNIINNNLNWRDEFFIENNFQILKGNWPQLYPLANGIRTVQYKYIKYFVNDATFEELFDLIHDPNELNNLAFDFTYQSVLEDLRNSVKEYIKTTEIK